jgi:hypothetical protein
LGTLTRLKTPLGWEISILGRKKSLKVLNTEERQINFEKIKNEHLYRIKLAQAEPVRGLCTRRR